ncbi:uncharacterized protein LOC110457631, partial [Mizuhopecten yessoensis]|uniref:uncharacterized protein LOC110457631 n=1 Tax=Mizuhopecten yessoensis TaxID=6573 RepID=UPI000B45F62B
QLADAAEFGRFLMTPSGGCKADKTGSQYGAAVRAIFVILNLNWINVLKPVARLDQWFLPSFAKLKDGKLAPGTLSCQIHALKSYLKFVLCRREVTLRTAGVTSAAVSNLLTATEEWTKSVAGWRSSRRVEIKERQLENFIPAEKVKSILSSSQIKLLERDLWNERKEEIYPAVRSMILFRVLVANGQRYIDICQ